MATVTPSAALSRAGVRNLLVQPLAVPNRRCGRFGTALRWREPAQGVVVVVLVVQRRLVGGIRRPLTHTQHAGEGLAGASGNRHDLAQFRPGCEVDGADHGDELVGQHACFTDGAIRRGVPHDLGVLGFVRASFDQQPSAAV